MIEAKENAASDTASQQTDVEAALEAMGAELESADQDSGPIGVDFGFGS